MSWQIGDECFLVCSMVVIFVRVETGYLESEVAASSREPL